MKRALSIFCLLLGVAVGAIGCGGGSSSSGETSAQTSTQSSTSTTTANPEPHRPKKGSWGVVFAAENEHGIMLFDLSGHTLYRFDGDKGSVSTCYGACAKAWPPALTEGKIRAVGVPRKLVGTSTRKDGTVQLTFDDHPLYTHKGERSGDFSSNGVTAFGGTWHALRRTGEDVAE